ncbi:MAG: ComEC family competence protein [Bacteroidetes bacterium]|nr:ComEC family competence protein [Bacteroidota bacterium]
MNKRWPLNKAMFWERAPFFRLLLPLIAGIIVYTSLPHPAPGILWPIFIGSFVLFVTLSFVKKISITLDAFRFVLLNTTLIGLGWGLSYYNDIQNNTDWFAKNTGGSIAVITNTPEEKDKTWKLETNITGGINENKLSRTTGKAFVYVYKDSNSFVYHEGDTIIIPSEWQPIKNAGNPFEFDYAGYCAKNNLYYQQFVAPKNMLLYNALPPNPSWVRRIHLWCMQQLALYIHDKNTLGLMQAILIGDEVNFDKEMRQAYAETGIIHIVAISGSHITFFFFIITFLLGWIKHKKYHWVKYVVAIPLIWLYVVMAGAPPSAVRSALMFSILGIGFAFQKQNNTLNHLFATAFILLCVQPMWLYSLGFQLSFLAVLSLVLFYKPIYNWFTPTHIITKALWATIAASIAAEILVAPLVIYYFHIFPTMFIVANIIAYLLMSVVMVLGMLVIAASGISSVASFIGSITVYVVKIFNTIVIWMQGLNPKSFLSLDIHTVELILIYTAIMFLAVFFLKKKRQLLYPALASVILLMTSLCYDEWVALHQRTLVVYNINKSNHIELIEGKSFAVLNTSDSVSKRNKNYVLKPAHIGFHTNSEYISADKEIFNINGQTVLILDTPVYSSKFPIDYIIINYPFNTSDIQKLQLVFTPKQIILGSNISRRETDKCIAACQASNISLYCVSKDGAFILKSF